MISKTENFVNTSVIELFRNEYRKSVSFESAFGSINSVSVLVQVFQTGFGSVSSRPVRVRLSNT